MIEIYLRGKIVQRSRNLRGLITRAHKIGVARVSLWRTADGASYYVAFKDGSELRGQFAAFTTCRDFFRSRWARWGLYAEVRNSDDYWSFI